MRILKNIWNYKKYLFLLTLLLFSALTLLMLLQKQSFDTRSKAYVANNTIPIPLCVFSTSTITHQFNNPIGIALDTNSNLYVVDSMNNRIQKFNADGTFISMFGGYGCTNGQFAFPSGITIDSQNKIYVADSFCHRIQVFNSTGTFLFSAGRDVSIDFVSPFDIAVDTSGYIYVIDALDRVVKLNSTGQLVKQWGTKGNGPGQFNSLSGITIDSDGNIYVADSGNHRIQKFDSNGNYLLQWSTIENIYISPVKIISSGNYIFVGIYGYMGNIYGDKSEVKIYDKQGNFINYLKGDYEPLVFDYSSGIAINSTSQKVYVTSSDNNIYQLTCKPPTPTAGPTLTPSPTLIPSILCGHQCNPNDKLIGCEVGTVCMPTRIGNPYCGMITYMTACQNNPNPVSCCMSNPPSITPTPTPSTTPVLCGYPCDISHLCESGTVCMPTRIGLL
ncbi:6-bladed beta-propeller [Candidatus Microgenomates bacterium]|nr:6-bladed beta-propeller [Candidatus Microgenomates bacterium]